MKGAVIEVCVRMCVPVRISYLRVIMHVRLFHQICRVCVCILFLSHKCPDSPVCNSDRVRPLAIDQRRRALMERLRAALAL